MEKINCYLCGSSVNQEILTRWKNDNGDQFNIVNCECNFKFLNPRPTFSEIGDYYNSVDYHPHSKGNGIVYYMFNLSRRLTYRWKLRIMKKQVKTNIRHLDYGSGDKSFVNFLVKKGISSLSYDEFYQPTNNDIVNSRKFNLITLWHSLEHIHNLDKLFLHLDDLLEKNGKIILAVPNFNAPERKYFNDNWKAYDFPRHLYHFDSFSLDKLLEIKGFRIVDRKRMLLDTIYISLLSRDDSIGYFKLFNIIIKSIIRVLLKGPLFSSSLLYICEKNN